jgi:hypoxanthine phosphoribosyltransferase
MSHYETLISPEQIAARCAELGKEIRDAHGDAEITLVGVLRGSVIFLADLCRHIPGDVRLEFLGVASYEGTKSTGTVRITHDLSASIEGRHVVVVEDIVDTGLTLDFLLRTLAERRPASLRTASLLDKPAKRTTEVPVEWVGFSIEDHFVVGYGLDLDQRYRNLPMVAIYHP